jgi:large subunit ribosomal protein L17
MRHNKKGKKLNRKPSQRKALFKSLIENLINNEKIDTTIAKAKAIKPLVDKLVQKAKKGDLSARREVMSFLPTKQAANKLVDEIAPRYQDVVGGAVRIRRIGKRRGDGAMMARIEWVNKSEEAKKDEEE